MKHFSGRLLPIGEDDKQPRKIELMESQSCHSCGRSRVGQHRNIRWPCDKSPITTVRFDLLVPERLIDRIFSLSFRSLKITPGSRDEVPCQTSFLEGRLRSSEFYLNGTSSKSTRIDSALSITWISMHLPLFLSSFHAWSSIRHQTVEFHSTHFQNLLSRYLAYLHDGSKNQFVCGLTKFIKSNRDTWVILRKITRRHGPKEHE